MTEESIYVMLQSAIERSKGAASWADVSLSIMQVKEKKVREQLAAILMDLSLDDLVKAHAVCHRELGMERKATKAK